ncbi:uncharacterized protein LOC143453796 [Clavelina lepadiformis]|uniref:uncharacterized protein LOC143453796 n=1 Tax=Clavelina lepadiformis TaxID=159417 RepID=UPI004042AE49
MAKQGIKIRRSAKDLESVGKLWGSGMPSDVRKHSGKLRHRSDMLFRKQLNFTSQVTSSLQEVVAKFEKSDGQNDRQLLQQILVFSRMIQHLKLVMEMLYKLNLEIKFCRRKLVAAVAEQNEEAELIRERINWLERKLETIVKSNSTKSLYNIFKTPQRLQEITQPSKFVLKEDSLLSKPGSSAKKSVILDPYHQRENDVGSTILEIPDEAAKYWLTGHHRFSYTPNMGQLLEGNPLSYHNIGLAIPASYVNKNIFASDSGESPSLPWMNEQDPMKGNFDILRDDLERIRKRIHRIHEKIYAASNLSLNEEASSISSGNVAQQETLKYEILQMPGTAESTRKRSTKDARSITARSLAKMSSSATPATSSVSVTSDLPPPNALTALDNVMPLTKTNMAKSFPHRSDHWCNAEPTEDGPDKQPTIVDQRGLLSRTRLRLFIPKRNKPRTDVVRDLITPSSVASNRSFRKIPNTVRFIENLKSSKGSALSDLQRERLNELIKTLSSSPRIDDRIYAARSLSSLGVTALDETIPALIESLSKERSSNVRFEISKALVKLGEWHPSALNELNHFLLTGRREVTLDVLEHLACSEAAKTEHLQINEVAELRALLEILRSFAASDEDEISFQAAVCLGEICGISNDNSAKMAATKLMEVLKGSINWERHSQALEVLVRQLHHVDENILNAIFSQLQHATKWQDRLAAALLIAHCGPAQVLRIVSDERVYHLLFDKLWDDARRDVRLGVSQAFTALGLRNRLMEDLDEQIRDASAEIRSRAVMAISAVGIKSDKSLRFLVEMLGLDSSDYVRLQIMRTFNALRITDVRVVRALREREKAGGPLGREASKTLASLDVRITTAASTATQRRGNQNTAAGRLTTASSWFSSFEGRETRESRRRNHPTSRNEFRFTPGSRMSSSMFSSPQYEIVSTSVRRPKFSSPNMGRAGTGESIYLTSASSFF